MYNLHYRLAQFKDQKKKLQTYIIVRNEHSINENTTRHEIQIMLNYLDMSEICCIFQNFIDQRKVAKKVAKYLKLSEDCQPNRHLHVQS